ncbi:MAG: acetate--CoA ligase [Chloroflexota bacterium]
MSDMQDQTSVAAALSSTMYHPAEAVIANANVPNYMDVRAEALADPLSYWDARAKEMVEWYQPYETIMDNSNAPFFKWFLGGKINIAHNALDRHADGDNKDKVAFIWESEAGETKKMTYAELRDEVNRFANVLKSQGVKKGDTVTIYMGRVLELPIAMLAVVKIGAIHSVVYGGFSSTALADRIGDADSKVLITCDGAWLRGKTVNLKDIADEALAREDSPATTCIVYQATNQDVNMTEGRDVWWHEAMAGQSADCETEQMDAEDPMFILYTSGTTGRPKGVMHTCGGYQVYTATTLKYVFDVKEDDVWWCAADPGWITGHSYIVYSPLVLGLTSIIYEGAPGYPSPDRWWEIVDRYGCTILYTAPTAIRGLMRFGDEWPNKHSLSTLRLLGTVGEPINPEAWRWYHTVIGKEQCPIIDTWWQTETGGFMITPTPVVPLKPGSATVPFTGIEADVVREDGSSCDANEDGYLVVKGPWPGMARTVWGDPQRYQDTYWSEFAEQGWYFTGDSARKDDDGYFWIIGRMDDVIKVSGYRLGTAEIESALVSHESVAESACIGIPDELRGNVIHAYCILNAGVEGSDELVAELKAHVRSEVGPIAVPAVINLVDTLPKTRSGKIMRRLLKAEVLGQEKGDTSTLED